MTKIMNGKIPKYLEDLFKPKQSKTSLVLRDADNKLEIPFSGINYPQTNAKVQDSFHFLVKDNVGLRLMVFPL